MKTIHMFATKTLAVFLAFTFILTLIPITSNALSYSGSSSYMSGQYYRNLTAVTLTGNNRTDIVNIAASQVGYHGGSSSSDLSGHSSSSSDFTEYGRWYGLQDMWCAMFVSWCAKVAGISTSVVPKHSFTVSGLQTFMNQSRAYSRATIAAGGYTPQPGDIIYFKSPRNTNITNHVGIVTSYSGSTVYTIEGNTSSNNVARKSYSISNTTIVYICKPNYNSSSASVSPSSSYINTLETSDDGNAVSWANKTVTSYKTVDVNSTFVIKGWSVHTDGIDHFQWNMNNTSWGLLNGTFRSDVWAAHGGSYPNCSSLNAFEQEVPAAGFGVGEGSVQVRAVTKSGAVYNVGTIVLTVTGSSGGTSGGTAAGTYINAIDAPVSMGAAGANQIITTSTYTKYKGTNNLIYIGGWSVHDGGISRYQYDIDEGDWYDMDSYYREDVANATGFTQCTKNAWRCTLDISNWSVGEHKIGVRGFNANESVIYTIGWIIVNVVDEYASAVDTPQINAFAAQPLYGSTQTVNNSESLMEITGWHIHRDGIKNYSYAIENTSLSGTLAACYRTDVANAFPTYTACNDINGFSGYVSFSGLSTGSYRVVLKATTKTGTTYAFAYIPVSYTKPAVTPSLSTDKSTYGVNDAINVTIAGNSGSWVGLFKQGESYTSTNAFYKYTLASASSSTTVNLASLTLNRAGEYTAGTYVVALLDASNTQLSSKTITIVASEVDIEVDTSSGIIYEEDNYGKFIDISKLSSCADLLNMVSDGCSIIDANGNAVSGKLKTGYIVVYKQGDVVVDEITIIVQGDVNGDGLVNAKDALLAKRMTNYDASNIYHKAADVLNVGQITSENLAEISKIIVG